MSEHAAAPYLGTCALARKLGASRTYLWSMKRAGFQMPGRRATVEEARQWLRETPAFRVNAKIVNQREPL